MGNRYALCGKEISQEDVYSVAAPVKNSATIFFGGKMSTPSWGLVD